MSSKEPCRFFLLGKAQSLGWPAVPPLPLHDGEMLLVWFNSAVQICRIEHAEPRPASVGVSGTPSWSIGPPVSVKIDLQEMPLAAV
jgi:hypothetical protein